MSTQPGAPQPTDSHRGLRLFGLAAVAAGLLLLMAAAFVLSYTGIHAVALSAGVSGRFARIYPVIFDAMLVIACAAVLSLRGAGLPSRCYAWLTMLVLLAAAAGADTVHATSTSLPHKPAAAAAAIIPWALVLIGFGLLLAMLRQARLRRAALTADPERTSAQPSGHAELRHGIDDLLGARSSGTHAVGQLSSKADPPDDPPLDLAIDAEPGLDDPASDEGHTAARPGTSWGPASHHQTAVRGSGPASAFSPAPTGAQPDDTAAAGAGVQGERRAGASSVPEARRAPETVLPADVGPAHAMPEPAPLPEPGPIPEDEAAEVAAPAAEDGAAEEAGPTPEDGAAEDAAPAGEDEPGPMTEAGAIADGSHVAAEELPPTVPADGAQTTAEVPQFERMRSSPVPPEH